MSKPESDWSLLNSGPGEPALNMAWDEALLEAAAQLGHPVLRSYAWTEPAATFGYFQRHAEVERLTSLRPLIRRPTGGGLVPHDADWTYSVVVPPNNPWYRMSAVDSYRRMHEWIRDAFEKLSHPTELAPCRLQESPGQCFVGAERFDLLHGGRKLAGAAQRRNRLGLLIQGSIQPAPTGIPRGDWEQAMCNVLAREAAASWTPLTPAPSLRQRARELADQKYSRPAYNNKR
jgi:lipoate-protein ligase A